MIQFAPNAVRDLLVGDNAPAGLASLIDDRVSALVINEEDPLPAVTYSELEDNIERTKDGPYTNGHNLIVKCHSHQDSGGYIIARKVARMVRQGLEGKTVQVVEDHHLDGEFSVFQFTCTGVEDLEFVDIKDTFITALTFRAFKIK